MGSPDGSFFGGGSIGQVLLCWSISEPERRVPFLVPVRRIASGRWLRRMSAMLAQYLRYMPAPKPVFDRRIFWDEDCDRMDLDAKWRFVIERVFERGCG